MLMVRNGWLDSLDVIESIRTNQRICEPFGEIVDNAFESFNRDARGFDIQGEQENDDVTENICQNNDDNENDDDDQIYHGGAPLQPVQPIVSDELLNEKIRSLNIKQRKIFNFILKWTRETIQSRSHEHGTKPEPFHIFINEKCFTLRFEKVLSFTLFPLNRNQSACQGVIMAFWKILLISANSIIRLYWKCCRLELKNYILGFYTGNIFDVNIFKGTL